MYAIKVYLKKPRKNVENIKYDIFRDYEKNYYLMRDMEDNIVHIYTDKNKAQQVAEHLQHRNPKSLITITNKIPQQALKRGLNKIGYKSEEVS